MMKDISGQKFGRLIVIESSHIEEKSRCVYWKCKCDCGNEKTYSGVDLRRGYTKSCGCIKTETLSKLAKDRKIVPEATRRCYKSWQNMTNRCYKPKTFAYERYGGRGIIVDDDWKDFENFYKDMGNPPDGMEIERIDNNKNYCKSNCKWATHLEQMRNSSINRNITINNETKTLSQWLLIYNCSSNRFYKRINKGWNEIDAIIKPSLAPWNKTKIA